MTGCEVNGTRSADSPITVSPESVTLGAGQSQQFTASGGYDYTWSLNPDDGSGKLSTRSGATTVYTCLSTNIGSMPKQVVATSTIQGTSSGTASTTNAAATQSYQASGSAEVFWPGGTGGGGNASISGSTSDLATNATRTFSASGGTPPYTWTVVSGGGSFTPTTTSTSGGSTTYTAPSAAATVTIRAAPATGGAGELTFNVIASP